MRRRPRPLRTQIILYLAGIHLVLAAVAVVVVAAQPLLLVAIEALFGLSVLLGWLLVRSFFVPLDLIRTGAELIGEGDFTTTFREVGQPEMDALIQVYNQMLARLREERLRAQEQNAFLERVLAASPGGVLTLDFDGRISQINRSAEELLGVAGAAVLGQSLEESGGALGGALAGVAVGESRVLALPGGRRLKASRAEFYDRGFARSFFVVEELTGELRASERAAYGQLIRMMSHEVNNSVGAVGSLLDSFRGYSRQLAAGDRQDFAQGIAVAVTRLENLRSFMNGFAEVVRLPPPELRPADLRQLLGELLLLLRPELERRRIACEWAAGASEEAVGDALVLMDRNQIEQVLVNVLRNSMEAIGSGGRITLRLVRSGGREGRLARSIQSMRSMHSRQLTLAIADSGPGIGEEVRPLLFTPFFSTKRNGRGLGLTLVREILGQHGCEFSLENRGEAEGGGAEFILVF